MHTSIHAALLQAKLCSVQYRYWLPDGPLTAMTDELTVITDEALAAPGLPGPPT